MQSGGMETQRAAEHLQVIRTLMERSALYRRALAPIMIFAGVLGVAAALAGWRLGIVSPAAFIAYWYGVAAVVLTGAFLLVRRQAWRQSEPFWSPLTRRVALALLPSLTTGFVLGLLVFSARQWHFEPGASALAALPDGDLLRLVPLGWVVLYGCALHAAGFFMTRGMRWFGWGLVLTGGAALLLLPAGPDGPALGQAVMGGFFGALHLAYGVYLHFTEPRESQS